MFAGFADLYWVKVHFNIIKITIQNYNSIGQVYKIIYFYDISKKEQILDFLNIIVKKR